MKKTRMLALLLAVLMTAALFAGCGNGGGKPQETTPEPKQTTTAAPQTEQTTTTEEVFDFGGYEFTLAHSDGLSPDYHGESAKADELKEIYAEIEAKYNIKIEFINTGDEVDELLGYIMSGDKAADFINVRQFTWIPLSVQGSIRPLDTDEVLANGMDVHDPNAFNQFYTKMMEMNGHTWGVDVTGKYYQLPFGHVYAFNKRLVTEAGYSPEQLFEAVYKYEWDYDMFLEIARKITKDLDGDGVYDIWGVALDCDGNEIWSNGTGPIVKDDATGKWMANLSDPKLIKAMEFMNKVTGDPQVQLPLEGGEVVLDRGDRRAIFYEGKAGFAGLFGKNFGKGGTHDMVDPVGLLPIPKGPDTDHYMVNTVDVDCFVTLTTNKDWEKSVRIMHEIGTRVYDEDEYREFIEECLQYDEDSIKVLFDYLLPNALMNIAKPSRDMYELIRHSYYKEIYTGAITPAQAAEKYQNMIQAGLDDIFKQN